MSPTNDDGEETLRGRTDGGTHRREFDSSKEPPSIAVVSLVAAVSGERPTDLDPLNEVIDPDALDALFGPTAGGRFRGDGRVEFPYHGFDVTVHSYGIVEVEAR